MDRESGGRDDRWFEPEGGTDSWRTDSSATDTGLEPNVAGALSYLLLFVSGIAFYVLEDDEFVRFHAAQSIVVFGGLAVVNVVVSSLFVALGSLTTLLSGVLSLVTLALWVFLTVTAYEGQTRRIPVAAGIADNFTSGTGRSKSSSGYGDSARTTTGSGESDAVETLRQRYAQGKIGDDEFERKLERLLEREENGEARSHETERRERSW